MHFGLSESGNQIIIPHSTFKSKMTMKEVFELCTCISIHYTIHSLSSIISWRCTGLLLPIFYCHSKSVKLRDHDQPKGIQ